MLGEFRRIFGGKRPSILARAPGRVTLIGSHTDYNGGLVMPVTVDRDVTVLGRRRRDDRVRLHSLRFAETVEFSLDDIKRSSSPFWLNYPKGVAQVLQVSGVSLYGLDGIIGSDLPPGGGMGSSAALEVATALTFLAASDFNLVPRDLAILCRKAENDFVGVKCGIMDQFSSIYGRKGRCLFLDCLSLDYERIVFPDGFKIVVCDTGARHRLSASSYNRRRRECEEGVKRLRKYLPGIEFLRDATVSDLRKYGKHLPEAVRKRCLHVVEENRRTELAARKLAAGDLKGFGRLLDQSHRSSRDLFECSTPELDFLVEEARKLKGVAGARLTGAGFGGCTVNLVEEGSVAGFKKKVADAYRGRFGQDPKIYVCRTAPGAVARSF